MATGYGFVNMFKTERVAQEQKREVEKKHPEIRLKDGDKFKLRFLSREPFSYIKVNQYPSDPLLFMSPEDLPADRSLLPANPRAAVVFPVIVEDIQWGAKTLAWIAEAKAKAKDPTKAVSEQSMREKYMGDGKTPKVCLLTFEGQNAEDVYDKDQERPLNEWTWTYRRKGSGASDTRYELSHEDNVGAKLPAKYAKVSVPDIEAIIFPSGASSSVGGNAVQKESDNFAKHAKKLDEQFQDSGDAEAWDE